ncbi:MAG: cupin domain-containing protein [Lachnospiraceae bacterium]|nr:cupin domain-containing protein [Lachnospiraceae bacterium]
MEALEIYRLENSLYNQKENLTKVNYFIFDEYEIHFNIIPSKTSQEWHMHREIEEALFVISGEILVRWKDNNIIREKLVSKNSVIRVKNSIHTVENRTNEEATFLVYRMVPDGTNKRDIIKNDKVIFSI